MPIPQAWYRMCRFLGRTLLILYLLLSLSSPSPPANPLGDRPIYFENALPTESPRRKLFPRVSNLESPPWIYPGEIKQLPISAALAEGCIPPNSKAKSTSQHSVELD